MRGTIPPFPHPEPPLLQNQTVRAHPAWLRQSAKSADEEQLSVVVTTFAQQLKRQNTPRAKNSLFLCEQEATPFSGVVCAQNSGMIRATRPLDRGKLSDL
jgi:hypothetical protein